MIMEEDGEESPRTPFWVQSSRGRQFRISSIFLNSTILIIFLCLSAIFSILFIIPWFLSLTSQIFRPNLVKKTWDWLNAALIILALIFGFLSRNKNTDDDRKLDEEDRTLSIANKSRSHFQWDRFSDEGTSDIGSYNYSSSFGLKRNSSSYPDLRDTTSFFDHRRFLDDTHVENSRFVDPDQTPVKKDLTFESDGSKNIYIHTKETILKKEISHTPSPPPPPPPKRPSFPPSHNVVEEKTDRALKQVTGHWENMIKNSSKQGTPPATAAQLPEKKKSNKSERKRSGGTATKDFINSFYHQSKKKKKQRAQSLDNFESLLEQIPPSPPSPPPPPPPAKTSVLHNIISNKKRKPKKIISVPAPPPPPPPPPAAKPLKIRTLNRVGKTQEDSSPATMGNESPLIPIPPPPPPPFKMPSWKFVVQGDYVRLGSFNSSISESSDTEERESPMSDISIVESSGTHITAAPENTTAVPENNTAAPSLFCPSPDVNTKAEMFIAKFRAGLQLQKINSLEQKQRLGMSNLGPQAQDQAQSQAQLRNARK